MFHHPHLNLDKKLSNGILIEDLIKDGDLKNIATLYACWEPKVYDIKIHKNTGNFITLKLPYGTSVKII